MHAQAVKPSPQNDGMSDGWTLMMRFSYFAQKLSGSTVIKPARTIRPISLFAQQRVERLAVALRRVVFLSAQHGGLDTCLRRPLEREGVRLDETTRRMPPFSIFPAASASMSA